MEKSQTTPDEYLSGLEDEGIRQDMQHLDRAITEIFGRSERVLWEGRMWGGTDQTIIGYGDWTYERSDKQTVEWFMVGLAVQKAHLSVYVNATEDGHYATKKYADKLGKVKVGSSSISFKELADVNIPELLKLVRLAKEQL